MNSLARLTGWLAGRVGGAGEASRCVAPKLNIPVLPIIFPRLHSNEFQETSNLPSYVYSLVWWVPSTQLPATRDGYGRLLANAGHSELYANLFPSDPM